MRRRFTETTPGLTMEERMRVIELALNHYEGRWVERQIRAARTLQEAIRVTRELCSWWGYLAPGDLHVWADAASGPGIYVETPDGRRGIVTWREIAEHAWGPQQVSLPI
ncbi:MAG TPA: hypothetical protein VIK99_04030 [Thermaerobacter sp.]